PRTADERAETERQPVGVDSHHEDVASGALGAETRNRVVVRKAGCRREAGDVGVTHAVESDAERGVAPVVAEIRREDERAAVRPEPGHERLVAAAGPRLEAPERGRKVVGVGRARDVRAAIAVYRDGLPGVGTAAPEERRVDD